MGNYIPFDIIMKNSNNWHEDIDFDNMSNNYTVLKPLIDKFYFRETPTNPQAFSLVFSDCDFASTLLVGVQKAGITKVESIIFCEYQREDKEKLKRLGIIHQVNLDNPLVIYTYNQNTVFVNVLL